MQILLTRPEPAASRFAGLLGKSGHGALIAPLLEIRRRPVTVLPLDGVQALIATSRNALDAVAQTSNLAAALDLPLFAVGGATAERARELGFATVVRGPGRARALIQVIASMLEPQDGTLLHLAGAVVAEDIRPELELLGFRTDLLVVYDSVAASTLPEAAAKAMTQGSIDAVVLMSPRTAATYARLVARAGLCEAAHDLVHFCISGPTARQLAPLGEVPVRVAAAPTAEDMLALVNAEAAQIE